MYVFNLNVNTKDLRFFSESNWWNRIQMLERELSLIQQRQIPPGRPFYAMLIAPEYFFAKNCTEETGAERHYEYEDYIKIRQELTRLSRTYQGILIVPGTIAWKEQAVSQNAVATPDWAYSVGCPIPSWKDGVRKTQEEYKKFMQSIGEDNPDWVSYCKESPETKLVNARMKLFGTYAQNLGGDVFFGKDRAQQNQLFLQILQAKRQWFEQIFSFRHAFDMNGYILGI